MRKDFDKLLLKAISISYFFALYETTKFNFPIFLSRHVALQRGDVISLWIYVVSRNLRSVSILRNAICAKLHSCPTIHNLSHYCGIRQISFSTKFKLLYCNLNYILELFHNKKNDKNIMKLLIK